MKKLLMTLVLMPLMAFDLNAASEIVDGVRWYFETFSDGGKDCARIIAGKDGYAGDLTIPSALGGCPVTQIDWFAFADCYGLTSVSIPDGITSIGNNAFSGCDELLSVTLPKSVTRIGIRAFEGCVGLTSIEIPSGVAVIEDFAFGGCGGLTTVTIPDGVTHIGNEAFANCGNLTSVSIPSSVTSIERSAFEWSPLLTEFFVAEGNANYSSRSGLLCTKDGKTVVQGVNGSVSIPECVTSIGDGAFEGCYGLTAVSIPDSVTSIGEWAFAFCDELESVELPVGVTSIGDRAFFYCDGLTTISIPQCVARLSDVFVGCESITNVVVQDGVTSIGPSAFRYNHRLTSVTIPPSVTSIGNDAFRGCSGLTSVSIPNGVTSIGANAFDGCGGLTSVTIPPSVMCIGERAFGGCYGLTSVSIPNGVTSIGAYVFEGCSGLTSIEIPSSVSSIGWGAFYGTPFYMSLADGFVILGGGVLYEYKGRWNIPSAVTIPDGVTSIGLSVFELCDELTSVIIPPSVTNIGFRAFYGCSNLADVTIPSSVTSVDREAFGGTAFYDNLPDGLVILGSTLHAYKGHCPSVVRIPDGVMSISDCAFEGCSNLTSIEIPPSVMSIGYSAFVGSESLEVHISDLAAWCRIRFGGTWCPYNNWRLYLGVSEVTDLTIPEGVIHVGRWAFTYCAGITSVTIPSTVLSVETDAFAYCDLTSVSVSPENREYSSKNGLLLSKDGKSLRLGVNGDVVIPNGVTSIDESAFEYCEGLTSVEIPLSVTSIGDCAFSECIGLTSVVIPSSVRNVGEAAFSCCEGLASVEISPGVTSIGEGAFGDCVSLTSVEIPSSVVSIGDCAFAGCLALKKVRVPACVVGMDDVFYDCGFIEDVALQDGTISIPEGMFYGCRSMKNVSIPSSVEYIGPDAFDETPLEELNEGDFAIVDGCLIACREGLMGDVEIPEGVRVIAEGVFYDCPALTSVKIPQSLKACAGAFYGCDSIETIIVSRGCDLESVRQMFYGNVVDVVNVRFVYEDAPAYRTVRFDANCGSMSSECRKVLDGSAVGDIPKVMRKGYEFLGWFTAAVGGTQVTAETVVTKDVTFYAHWKRIGSTADEEVIAGEKVTIETGLVGYKASGLPKGLSYNAKTGKITGTTKSVTAGTVEVVFTKAGEEDVKMTFEVRAEDVSVGCAALATGSFQSGVMGAAGGIPIEVFCETSVKSVSVTKLPSGMKYDSKNRLITGAPNKAGNYEVVLTVTTTSGAKETVKIPVSVAAMPVMAVGKFDGFVSVGEDYFGTFTLTTTDAGKLTAKVITAAGTVSFSGTCWDAVEDGVYRVILTTKKGEKLTLTLDSMAGWDANQLSGEFTTAAIAETKKTAAVPARTYSVSAQRNAFGKTWYFAATGNETTGWKLAYTEDTKGAALTVTLKADGSTSIAGKLPNGTDTKGKAVTIKVSASGYANVGGLKDGAILADFAPVVTVNRVKKALAIKTNLWFDRKSDHESGVGGAKFVE